jgi:hypothetical protein
MLLEIEFKSEECLLGIFGRIFNRNFGIELIHWNFKENILIKTIKINNKKRIDIGIGFLSVFFEI